MATAQIEKVKNSLLMGLDLWVKKTNKQPFNQLIMNGMLINFPVEHSIQHAPS
tara:strand:+ start:845 stop:1003 length:159 start_codon:yes stop_codon:yes gene_type:complete